MQGYAQSKIKKTKACGVQAQAWRRRKIEVSRSIFNQIMGLGEVDITPGQSSIKS
jgi:hypothetical protein